MASSREPWAEDRSAGASHSVREIDLDRVMKDVPKGALALVGVAVGLVLILWLIVYFGVFLPRGPVS